MPLTEGTYWVYEGSVTWFDQQKQKAAETRVSLKMSVERVFRKQAAVFAVIKGHPSDLNFSTGEANPSRWVVIENAKHEVFLHELDASVSLPQSENPGTAFDTFMTDDDLWFEWPMARGKKFCDADSQKREDDMYCWIVDSDEKKALSSINGVSATTSASVYTLTYRTNPDDTEMEISPGIGIVAYRYHHHGTTADTDLKLFEFHPGSEKSASAGATQ